MKRYLILLLMTIIFFSCSKDEKIIAECKLGKESFSVKIKDLKNEFLNYSIYDPSILTKDINWYKEKIKYKYFLPEMRYKDLLDKGITNDENFKKDYERLKRNIHDGALIRKGQQLIMEKSKNGKHKVVRASHILFLVSKYKNVDNKQVEKTQEEYNQETKEIETKAQNIIESLKKSRNIAKDFSKTAKEMSQDPGSARNGGDLGYFTEGMMVKEFEDAVFSAKKPGILDKPVKTTYGYHVVYVTDPPKEKKLSEMKSKVGKDIYQRLERILSYKFQEKDQEQTVKELFKVDLAKSKIILDEKDYNVSDIPDDGKILSVYDRPYTWKDSKDIISFYVPQFMQNPDINSFLQQMGILKRFLYFRDIAKNNNYEKTAEFKKDYNENLNKYTKNLITQNHESELLEKAKSEIKEKDLRDFYNKNKQKFTREEKGKKIVQRFEEVKNIILEEIVSSNVQEIKRQWDSELEKKYKVNFNDGAIKELIAMEKDYFEKFKKAQEKLQKQQEKLQKQDKKK